jgi:hypothetical protein
MVLQMSEVTNAAEFAKVVKVEHKAYAMPANGFWEALKGPSIEECTERQWGWHKGTPDSHWLTVRDGKDFISGAQWIIYKTNPFVTPQPIVQATWWPEGMIDSSLNIEDDQESD